MSIQSHFDFIQSPDMAFPANRSPQPSSARSLESFALTFPFPPQKSDAQSWARSNDSFYPFSIEQIFPPAASSEANSSSCGEHVSLSFIDPDGSESTGGSEQKQSTTVLIDGPTAYIAAQIFTYRELATATSNFRPEFLLSEGVYADVYMGRLESTGQLVAVKKANQNESQENREFLTEVLLVRFLHHPNIANLIGHCAEGDHRLLVYEYAPLGLLKDRLFDLPPNRKPLDWNTRMKIAAGVAKALQHLHDKVHPPIIHRDIRSSNILLYEGYHPKLSNFWLAIMGPVGDETHISTPVMGIYGYYAPEYAMTGQVTLKCDVYNFGVVFLELITGRKAIDNTRGTREENLVTWARPLLKDRRMFTKMVDPLLQGQYPMRGLDQAFAVAAMCLQEQPDARPPIGDVVRELTYLDSQMYEYRPNAASTQKKLV